MLSRSYSSNIQICTMENQCKEYFIINYLVNKRVNYVYRHLQDEIEIKSEREWKEYTIWIRED